MVKPKGRILDRYLMFYEGSYQGETKCIPTTSKILIHYLKHIPLLKIWRNLENMKLNELGRQKLGRYRSPVSIHDIQSYILTYYRLRKWEPLIAHQEDL